MQIFKAVFLCLLTIAICSCQLFSDKKDGQIEAPENFQRLETAQLILESGFNAHYINSDQLIYLKDKAIDHDEIQIYLLNKDKPKKLTHLKGHNYIYKPVFSKNHFLFISDNESEKYNLNRIQKKLENKVSGKPTKPSNKIPLMPNEMIQYNYDIYIQNIESYEQKRITTQLTPDLWPIYHKKDLFFSRMWQDHLHIYQLNLNKNQAVRVTQSQQHHSLLSAQPHLVAWVEHSSDWAESKLVAAHNFAKSAQFKLSKKHIQSIDVHPTRNLILISAKDTNDQFELYALDVDKKCVSRLSYLKSNEYWPSWHPAGQKFVYTSDLGGRLGVYESQFFSDNPCRSVNNSL